MNSLRSASQAQAPTPTLLFKICNCVPVHESKTPPNAWFSSRFSSPRFSCSPTNPTHPDNIPNKYLTSPPVLASHRNAPEDSPAADAQRIILRRPTQVADLVLALPRCAGPPLGVRRRRDALPGLPDEVPDKDQAVVAAGSKCAAA